MGARKRKVSKRLMCNSKLRGERKPKIAGRKEEAGS